VTAEAGAVADPWSLDRDSAGVAVVVFDGGERRTMGIAAAAQLAAILSELAARPEPPVLVLVVDILHAELGEVLQMSHGRPIADWQPWLDAINGLAGYPSASLVAIPRQASCGGLELSIAADARIVAPDARLGVLEARMGIMPGAGGTQRIPRLAGIGAGALMCFLGEAISGVEAHRLGLAQAVDPDPVGCAVSMAERMAARGAPVLMAVKRALLAGQVANPEGYRQEGKAFLSVVSRPEADATMRAWLDRQSVGDPPALDPSSLP
jgi:enoyl-CoA hydratase/carnithine racemase